MNKEYDALWDKRDELWRKACAWDGISPDTRFVAFSDANPWVRRYNKVERDLLEMNCRLMESADRWK